MSSRPLKNNVSKNPLLAHSSDSTKPLQILIIEAIKSDFHSMESVCISRDADKILDVFNFSSIIREAYDWISETSNIEVAFSQNLI